MRYIGTSILVFCLTLLLFTGCMMGTVTPEPDDGDSQNLSKGTLKIYLTDALEKNGAPDTYDAILISISRIEAHFVETYKEKLGTEVADGSKKGNWQKIADWSEEGGFEVDLIELEGKSIFLASELLPSGKYTQLRVFLVEDQGIIVVDGEEHELVIPSVGQTGIKLIHPFEITCGQITELTLDFDSQQSVIETGNGEYKLKPVIGIISSYSPDEDESYFGSIEGLVYELVKLRLITWVIGDALVEIEGVTLPYGETYWGTTHTNPGGYYKISDIPFGVYKVTASAEGYTESFQNIIIDSDEVITVDFGLEPVGE